MANFNISYKITKNLEGGYANHPKDNGGETYAGISRKFHPMWVGWPYIDRRPHPIKNNSVFPKLDGQVKAFYKREYWQKLFGDHLHQSLANQIYDYAVNSGKGQAVKDLQRILNSLGEKLQVDGVIGPLTLAAIGKHDQDDLARRLHAMRTLFLSQESKVQPHFREVWQNRLQTMKSYLPSVAGLSLGLAALATIFF
jgi:lysozyme family protein